MYSTPSQATRRKNTMSNLLKQLSTLPRHTESANQDDGEGDLTTAVAKDIVEVESIEVHRRPLPRLVAKTYWLISIFAS